MTLLPHASESHRVSILEGVASCDLPSCDFKLNVAAYGHARALQIGHCHIANPTASKLELLEFIAIGHGK